MKAAVSAQVVKHPDLLLVKSNKKTSAVFACRIGTGVPDYQGASYADFR
jgi:hypothetical protein